ncbi:GAF domain-containing protein [Terrabacter sp. NPDC080008]|uniref:GAF domain-containing protein n=1 Tax=Terrabacter sp. NPDC080008 TaxID=3155176 RepID=UPI00344C2C71
MLTRLGKDHLRAEIEQTADALTLLVPGIAAVSVGARHMGITLTYVATAWDAARLDAVQYLDDGPCEQASRTAELVVTEHTSLLDEGRWQLFARASAAAGILSSLSLPVVSEDAVVGGINLYGRALDTFDGHHEQIAEMLGAWAPGAVTNADLEFTTRTEAAAAPRRLQELHTVRCAVRMLAARSGVQSRTVETQLYEAAARAGIPVVALAHMVIGEGDHDAS